MKLEPRRLLAVRTGPRGALHGIKTHYTLHDVILHYITLHYIIPHYIQYATLGHTTYQYKVEDYRTLESMRAPYCGALLPVQPARGRPHIRAGA